MTAVATNPSVAIYVEAFVMVRSGGTPVLTYRMLARDPTNTMNVRWTVTGAADWTGVSAPGEIFAGSAVVL